MWAKQKQQSGFTIVELLIVIVVIAILAAITLVAYNGITSRAQAALVQSDLRNAATTLEAYNATNGTYPPDLPTASLPASNGTTYQYTVNTSAAPATFCLTATNAATSYYINNTTVTTPTAGGCPGDGVGGVAAVTNLATNPSFESDLAGWSGFFSPTRTRVSEEAETGSYSQKIVTVSSTEAQGAYLTVNGPFGANTTLQASIWVKASAGIGMSLGFRSPTQTGGGYSSVHFTTTGSWQLVTTSYVVPATPESFYAPQLITTSPFPAVGTTFYIDGLMIVQGNSLPNYADGTTPNWIWNGIANDSTSTGPPV